MEKYKPIIIVIACTLLTSFGQILLKMGANKITTFISIFNLYLISGLVLYAIGAALLVIALKYGDLSHVYPFIALSFIWVTILSIFVFKDMVNIIDWLGIASILIGVSFIGFGSKSRRAHG
jgi:drug/metabolite transporter (DMT)-like permease